MENEKSAVTFLALNAADYLTTKKILKDGGEELNPVANFFLKRNLFGFFKIAAGLLGAAAILNDDKENKTGKSLITIYGGAVANNVIQISKQNKYKKRKKKLVKK